MNNPTSRPHGRLTHTPISVSDALAFVAEYSTEEPPASSRFAVAVTAVGARPQDPPVIVAVAVTGRYGYLGTVAAVTVAFRDPTTRMRRMLLAAVWDKARPMGYTALYVDGDYRYPDAFQTEVWPRSAVRRPGHRKPRQRGRDTIGRRLTQQLVDRPYYTRWGS